MSQPKVYVPRSSAKERVFDWGSIISLGFHAEELVQFINEHANEQGYINLTISKRKTVGERGDTHSVALDDWKPTRGGSGQERGAASGIKNQDQEAFEPPF